MATIVMAIVAMIVALTAMGRRPWCKCGSLRPWSSDARGPCNSQHLADQYTLTHVEHGLAFWAIVSLAGVEQHEKIAAAVLLEAIFEVIENTPWAIERFRANTISRGYYGDSLANSVGDVVACLVGAAACSVLPWQASLATVVAIELALLWRIRDNLALSLLMFAWPIEAVRRWQERDGRRQHGDHRPQREE